MNLSKPHRWLFGPSAAAVASILALTPVFTARAADDNSAPDAKPLTAQTGDGKTVSDGKAKKVVPEEKKPEPRFKLYGWVEAGITGNPDSPTDNHNFGHLYTDRANEPLLNQFAVVAERTLDSSATGFDWGFKVWFDAGSDTRYSKSSGFMDLTTNERVQPDFPEIYVNLHTPIPGTAGGLDFKAGKYADPMSAETIDPRNNVFYSKSYIFNFGVPLTDTGFLATLHATKILDIYAGLNIGSNISFKDNNHSLAFEGGFGLNLLDGNVTIAALTHLGPENVQDNHDYRFYNDATATWKISKALTSITDLNLIHDQGFGGKWGYGVAQYFTYSVNDWFQLGIRGEVYWDRGNFFVAQFAGPNNEYAHLLRGDANYTPDPRTVTGGHTTYGEVTFGVTFKPTLPKPIQGLLIRPEVRYDRALTDTRPYDDSTSRDQVTIGCDLVLQF